MYLKTDALAVTMARRAAAATKVEQQRDFLRQISDPAADAKDAGLVAAAVLGALQFYVCEITAEEADVTAKIDTALASAEQVTRAALADQDLRDRIGAQLENADASAALAAAEETYEYLS